MVPLIILAIVLAAAAVGVGALLGGKSKSGATTQSPASTQSRASNKKQSPVSKWLAENQSKSDRLAKSMQATEGHAAGPDRGALRSDCQELGDASRAAAGGLPTPNQTLTNALRGAFDNLDKAAQECMTGVDSADSAALRRFTSDFQAGQKQIGTAEYIVGALNKRG